MTPKKKRYVYPPSAVHDYRGYKIEERRNAKTGRIEFKACFQINKVRYTPRGDTKKHVELLIDEIVYLERRIEQNLPIPEVDTSPTLGELFERILPTIESEHQHSFAKRVFENFLELLPKNIKVTSLKKSHFQIYIDWRKPQRAKQTKKLVELDTIYKELYAVSSALGSGELYFEELEKWEKPKLPKKKQKPKSPRQKIISPDDEFYILLAELRKPKSSTQTFLVEEHRRRLADDLEFRFETGLRRKEVLKLERKQYVPAGGYLKNVKRFKTGTVTKFFPLKKRAIELIENRIKNPGKYIFTDDGEPVHSDYRTLKTVCEKLDIPYGRFTEDGFIPHDLRHSFATEVIPHTDIKTAQELLGHSNIQQTSDYLHTTEARMREAIKKSDKFDLTAELVVIYKDVRRGKIKARAFVENVKKLLEK